MINLKKTIWLKFVFGAFISFLVWLQFTYPRLSVIDLSIDRDQAVNIARNYLTGELKVNLLLYQTAAIFVAASASDQYLQRAIGYQNELAFLREHDFELFHWRVRFFKEQEKEQYYVTVSAATGEVTQFDHSIDANAAREETSQDKAREQVITFLKKKFGFHPDAYISHTNLSKKFDNRTEHSFAWEKKGVFIPWREDGDSGGAKLIISARITGDDILAFHKVIMEIPDQYHRFLAKEQDVGRNLAFIFRIVFYFLLTTSIFFVVVRRNDLVMHTTKTFAIGLTVVLFSCHVLSYFNEFESIRYHYPTTSSFASYLWQSISGFLMDSFIVTIGILMPCLSGESLHQEVLPQKREGAFLHYLLSSFFVREAGKLVILGYLTAFVMIGIQSLAFEFGQRYLGVWTEYAWMARLSASYSPFLMAFVIGFSASFTEEISFRMFSLSLARKYLPMGWAVFLASVFWGFGHSTYMVFPMWFRGLEVTCIGIFLSGVYLRFGLIPVLVAHYLFDVFWTSAAYLLGESPAYHFYSSLSMLLLPAVLGLAAFLLNRPDTQRTMYWRLNNHQLFNFQVLKNYLQNTQLISSKPRDVLLKDIVAHGWDMAVVDLVLKECLEQPREMRNPNP
jgi:hypothetical protein